MSALTRNIYSGVSRLKAEIFVVADKDYSIRHSVKTNDLWQHTVLGFHRHRHLCTQTTVRAFGYAQDVGRLHELQGNLEMYTANHCFHMLNFLPSCEILVVAANGGKKPNGKHVRNKERYGMEYEISKRRPNKTKITHPFIEIPVFYLSSSVMTSLYQ